MIKTFNRSWTVFVLIAVLTAVLGGWLMIETTRWGPWAFSDSASYISAARNFSRGLGFVIINSNDSLTHVTEFPPFYPIFLSFFTGQDGDPAIFLRPVNVFLFICFLIILGALIFKATRSNLSALLGMALCAVSPVLLEVFSGVMSETLFLPLLCLVFLLVIVYLENRKPAQWILLAVFSSLMPITRYAGTLFVAVNALVLFVLSKSDLKKRFLMSGLYAIVALLPAAVWFLRLYLAFDKVGGKSFNLDFSILCSLLGSLLAEFSVIRTWLPYYGIYASPFIDQVSQWSFLIVFLVALVFLYRKYLHHSDIGQNGSAKMLLKIALIMLCAYVLFIAFTHSITIPQIDIIDRMMAPVIPLLSILAALTLAALSSYKKYFPLAISILVMLVCLRFSFLQSWRFAQELGGDGHGYSARQYQEAGIIDALQALPEDQRMVSNSAGFVLYHTNRFPIQIDQFANHSFGSHNGYGEKWVREKGAALILLYPDFRNYYGDTASQLLSTITAGLDTWYQDEVGGIYFYPGAGPTRP